ncbi:hypothetical protein BHT95_20380 [Bacillus paralicheniformis]|nr:hypothetical protein [Bacillus licheniformis]OLQ51947.1 hypothetical protein BHT95_20380 [Bacillus paralicheniformis]OAG82694.1 hypothetical protein AWE49_19600 [Bacillus licheniformis]OIS72104.1 hypothetical protein A4A38_18425 [Bacillus licheniformis]OIS79188.1 hypothetical protein A4A43_13515 [Bacillus licheniformis]
MRNKNAHRSLKYKSTLAANAAAVRTLLFVNLNFAVFVSVNLHIKDKFLALKKPAGNPRLWEGGY